MIRSFLRGLLRRLGYDAMARDRFDLLRAGEETSRTYLKLLREVFALYAANADHVYLLHIGANDGVKDDFTASLREPANVAPILVEPQRHCLAKLSSLQAENPRVRVLPVAFGESDGESTIYRFDREFENGIQLDVFSSFDRRMVLAKKRYFRLAAEVVEDPVETCTLRTLLNRGGAPRLDVLLCDIEGLDDLVIKQLLSTIRPLPVIVVFEHRWLTDERRRACYRSLADAGYSILHGTEDAFCFRLHRESGEMTTT